MMMPFISLSAIEEPTDDFEMLFANISRRRLQFYFMIYRYRREISAGAEYAHCGSGENSA